MMNKIIIETVFFYLLYLSSLVSISGFGLVFNHLILKNISDDKNIYSLFFWGLPFLLVLGFFTYVTIGYFQLLNLFLLLFGIAYFFYFRPISKDFLKSIAIPTFLFVGLLISKTHEDFYLYHYQHVKELVDSPLKLGLANLEIRYSYSSIFAYIQGFFYLPYLELKLFHVPVYLIYVSFIGYLSANINNSNKKDLKFFMSFITILLIIKFTRLSEFGYDYIGQFILLFLFIENIISKKKKNFEDDLKLIVQFVFALAIKITSFLFLPVVIYLTFTKKILKKILKTFFLKLKLYLFIFILLGIIAGNSFIKTGCIFYVFEQSCFSEAKITWRAPYEKIANIKKNTYLWSIAYEHQNEEKILSAELYSSNFNWIDNWIQKHFFYKISEFIIILIFLYFGIYYSVIKKSNTKNYNKLNSGFFLSSFIGLILWFILLPQYRFGFSLIVLTIYYFLWNISFSVKSFNNKKFNYLFLIAIVFFNLKNIYRINNEFDREDIYQYSNFPWHPNVDRKYIKVSDFDGDIYYKPNDSIRTCWNIPTICSYEKISIHKSNMYTTIKKSKNND